MAAISIGTLTDLEKVDYVREGLAIAKPHLIYAQYGVKDRVAKREGKTRQWFRMTKLGTTTGTSGNFSGYQIEVNTTGAPPTWTPATPADTTVTAQVDIYFGQGAEWNDAVDYTSFADIPSELRKINFQQAAENKDKVVKGVVAAGTNVYYANNRATRPDLLSTDQVDMNDFFDAVTVLRNNDAPLIKGMYSAMCSANVIAQLMKDSTFQSAVQFQKDYIFAGTIAELYGVRFDFTSQAATTTNGGSASQIATIDQTIITGDNAYGVTAWMMNDFDMVLTNPGGFGDEWAVRHALAWKDSFKSVILNQSWLVRLESSRAA